MVIYADDESFTFMTPQGHIFAGMITFTGEDIFWRDTLANLARHFGVTSPTVTQNDILVDPRMQWGEAGNVWHNSVVRTGINLPVRMVQRLFGQG